MASSPLLVTLGLTLPDSRILSGVASIGLTLANIAIILPHLRQPILDSIYALGSALTRHQTNDQSTQEDINLSPHKPGATQRVDLPGESLVLVLGSPREREHQCPPRICSATVKSACSAKTVLLGYPGVKPEVAPHALPSPAREISQIPSSLSADSSKRNLGASHLFAREGRGALYIPLPVPGVEEVAFFDTEDNMLSESDLGEEFSVAACEQYAVHEDYSVIEGNGLTAGEDSQLFGVDLPSTQGRVESCGDVVTPVAEEKTMSPPISGAIQAHHTSLERGTFSDLPYELPSHGPVVQSVPARHSSAPEKEVVSATVLSYKIPTAPMIDIEPAKHRPKSLEFVPQSVIRRYPSAPTASAKRCFGHRTFSSGYDHHPSLAPPPIFIHNPEILLQRTRPRANYTTLEGYLAASLLTPTRRSMERQAFSIKKAPAQEPTEQALASVLEAPTPHEITPLQKHQTHTRHLDVLACAALCDRRSAVHRRKDSGNDKSSTSDSDSDLHNDSRCSSESSTHESMLPHMLGADLIAAIDANSESELNLFGSKKTKRSPLNVHEDFLISGDSVANVSMVVQMSSNDDASDGEVGAPATFRSLTYEDIQQWATGVVQKCVRQVCRNRVAVEPSSPSQASDICAERPSSSGASQCPLSGLHCKLGAAALTEAQAPRTKEVPASLPPTATLQNRKLLQIRNLRDIPEFVPRQQHVLTMTGHLVEPRRHSTRSTMDATRDAAARVIARMENQAVFNARQWLVGTEERRMVNTAGGRQGALRCA